MIICRRRVIGRGIDLLQRLGIAQRLGSLLVPQVAVVLHLFARVLDFGEAERGRRALEEVT